MIARTWRGVVRAEDGHACLVERDLHAVHWEVDGVADQ
jgi:hypothetical protein